MFYSRKVKGGCKTLNPEPSTIIKAHHLRSLVVFSGLEVLALNSTDKGKNYFAFFFAFKNALQFVGQAGELYIMSFFY